MKVRLFGLFLILSVTLVCAQDDLTRLLQQTKAKDSYGHAPYVIVSEKTAVKVMETGLSHVRQETLYKVFKPEGASQLKTVVFGYDPQSAYVEIKEAVIIRKCGKKEVLDVNTVKDYPAPARAIYWGAREKMLPVGRLYPGDGLFVRLYRKGYTYALLGDGHGVPLEDDRYIPPMKGHFYDIVPFYSQVPVLKKIYKVSVPRNKELQFEFYNGQARHYARINGNRRDYLWEKTDIMPFEREPGMVSPSDVAPKLLLSTAPDWKAKSLWFYRVNEDFGSFNFDSRIKKKVDEIISGAADDWEKISRLTHWVAEEIRYSGISMGEGEGFTLHPGTMTFNDRCGVCKDKAGMLITMLRAAGFKSYPAMTMAGSRIDRIPADQFNHCVTVVKLNSKYHLLDPTWVPGVRELWSSAEQQQEYLMGVPEGADLASTPLSAPENHYISYRIKSRILENGTLSADIKVKAEGQSDSMLRRYVGYGMKTEWKKNMEQWFFQMDPRIRISELTYQNPRDISKPMSVSFKMKIADYALQGKDLTVIRPVSAMLPFQRVLGFSRVNTGIKKRQYPFRTRCSQKVTVTEQLKVPRRLTLDQKVEFKKIMGPGATFGGNFSVRGNTVTIKKELVMKKRIYQPADWPGFRQSVLEFNKPEAAALVFKGGKGK